MGWLVSVSHGLSASSMLFWVFQRGSRGRFPEQEQKWIPMTTRPMAEEEREYYREWSGIEEAMIFDCPLPDDGQEVLISYILQKLRIQKYINRFTCDMVDSIRRTHECYKIPI